MDVFYRKQRRHTATWSLTFHDRCGPGLNTAEVGNDVDSSMQVWQPAITSKPITETNSNQVTDATNYSDQGRNIAAALWPRFTRCNWCAGSYQAAEKHFLMSARDHRTMFAAAV